MAENPYEVVGIVMSCLVSFSTAYNNCHQRQFATINLSIYQSLNCTRFLMVVSVYHFRPSGRNLRPPINIPPLVCHLTISISRIFPHLLHLSSLRTCVKKEFLWGPLFCLWAFSIYLVISRIDVPSFVLSMYTSPVYFFLPLFLNFTLLHVTSFYDVGHFWQLDLLICFLVLPNQKNCCSLQGKKSCC